MALVDLEDKKPMAESGSAVANNLAVQTQGQQKDTRDKVVGNIESPAVPAAGTQTYSGLDTGDIAGGSQFAEGAGIEPDAEAQASTVDTTQQATAQQATAANMDAATVGEQNASTVEAAEGAVSQLIDPVTGSITEEAKEATGVVDPAAIVDAATVVRSPGGEAVAQTMGVAEKETVVGQMNELLSELENGNTPTWARPAVEQVEAMLEKRGLNRSSIGRNALFNAIIQAALPIAQQDAQTNFQRQTQNLNNMQQTALFNAQNVLQIDMANMTAEQQSRIHNSQTIQTMTLTNLSNEQQASMQNAVNMANMDMQNATFAQQRQIQNAQNFLQMDMSNLNNEQQARLVNQQAKQQVLLSDQAAENAGRQFNAANEQQVNQFNAQMGTSISQFNTTQANAVAQFNAGQEQSIEQWNDQVEFQRDQFNAQMYSQIEQSNVQWRRQMNQIDTAGENAVNQANAINAFNLSNQALTLAWQDLRDSAQWAFQASETDQEAAVRMAIAAMSSENEKASLEAANWRSIGGFAVDVFNRFT